MKSSVFSLKKMNFGFTMIELMTALIILSLLALVGMPMYQEYQIRSHMAEAESVVGTMERHAVAYLLDHGSFYTASPSPSFVPGINSAGDAASFTGGADWSTIGLPVSVGSEVVFSYQAFAGQTPSGSTTFVSNAYLHSPTENMNLERGATVAINDVFSNPVAIASADQDKIIFDWDSFNFCSYAGTVVSGTEEEKIRCAAICPAGDGYDACMQSCMSGGTGGTCLDQCRASGGSDQECSLRCGAGTGDTGDDGRNRRHCAIQCRGNASCTEACLAGKQGVGESDGHRSNRCDYACGGDGGRRDACMRGEDDCHDEGSCESNCRGDNACLVACNDNDHNACEASCKGANYAEKKSCLDACHHHSCQSSCHGDHNCLRECKHENCRHTCGGNSDQEQSCVDNDDGDDGGDHCITKCLRDGMDLTQCRTKCNVDNGDDDDGGGCTGHHCPTGTTWSDTQNRCVTVHSCPSGQTWNGTACVNPSCPEGQVWNGTSCVTSGGGGGGGSTCTPPQVWNGSTCVNPTPTCPAGQYWNGSACVNSTPTCPAGQYWNGSACVNSTPTCPAGQVWNGSACVNVTPTCPSGQTWNGTACVASGGSGTPNGECASFGVSAPVDFGVPTGVAGLDYVVFSGVANLRRGSECTLYVKVIKAVNKQVNRSQAGLVLNRGE